MPAWPITYQLCGPTCTGFMSAARTETAAIKPHITIATARRTPMAATSHRNIGIR
jgi:hypothetical protein